jgi:hypothetical protein
MSEPTQYSHEAVVQMFADGRDDGPWVKAKDVKATQQAVLNRVLAALQHGPGTHSYTHAMVGGKTFTQCRACTLSWPHDINWEAVITAEGSSFTAARCKIQVCVGNALHTCTELLDHYGPHIVDEQF